MTSDFKFFNFLFMALVLEVLNTGGIHIIAAPGHLYHAREGVARL